MVASIIALIFIFGIIIIIGWLTAWNLIGEFSAQTSDLVQKIYEIGGLFSELFSSIRNFVEDTTSQERKEELIESIDRTSEMIDRISYNTNESSEVDNLFEDSEYFNDSGLSLRYQTKTNGQRFKEYFTEKVEIYARNRSPERKIQKLHALNEKIGKTFGGSTIEKCLNIVDDNLVLFQNDPASFRRGIEEIVWTSIGTIVSSFREQLSNVQ